MKQLQEVFHLRISPQQLHAELWYNDAYTGSLKDMSLTVAKIEAYLKTHHVTFGMVKENIQKLVSGPLNISYPIVVAKGINKQDGENGSIRYHYNTEKEVDRSQGWNFRDVMRIPTVQEGAKIATLIPPTLGTNGRTVMDKEIVATPGKPYVMRAGNNVAFDQNEHAFYAMTEGQVSFGKNILHVHNVYEVHEDISLKVGNIDFLGNVVIRGDVPTGFTVKATGDVKVFGIVEAATIEVGGSIYISEGMAGLKTGTLIAKEDVYIGSIKAM